SSEGFAKRYEQLLNNHTSGKGRQMYVVRKGDTLYSIAKMFDIPVLSISIWNRLDKRNLSVRPGERLVIYNKKAEQDGKK
ncbi:MAG: LysM domain-containing protein, partial [Desulfobacterales bacterium]